MTIDTASADTASAGAAALPTQRGALPAATTPTDTRPLPVITPVHDTELPDAPRWQVYAAVAAGLLGGVLMVAGVVFPW